LQFAIKLFVYVVGGGNSAGQAVMHLAKHAKSVTMLVRDKTLAASMSQYLSDRILGAANVQVRGCAPPLDQARRHRSW